VAGAKGGAAKGGDRFVFGRGGESGWRACGGGRSRRAGAELGPWAGTAARDPDLTHRGVCRRLQPSWRGTSIGQPGRAGHRLARRSPRRRHAGPALAMRPLKLIAAELIGQGKARGTPSAVVYQATTAEQQWWARAAYIADSRLPGRHRGDRRRRHRRVSSTFGRDQLPGGRRPACWGTHLPHLPPTRSRGGIPPRSWTGRTGGAVTRSSTMTSMLRRAGELPPDSAVLVSPLGASRSGR